MDKAINRVIHKKEKNTIARQKVTISDKIFYVDDFLSEEECGAILEDLEVGFWQDSLTYQKQEDETYKNLLTPFRISETAHQEWFPDSLNTRMQKIEKRLQTLVPLDTATLETWQATDYPLKGLFDYHLDAGYWENHYAGERIHTFLLYLTTPIRGGGTHFRALDTYIEAKRGRLLIWNNLFDNGDPDHSMIHSSTPLLKGKKTTLVTWQRQKKFRL